MQKIKDDSKHEKIRLSKLNEAILKDKCSSPKTLEKKEKTEVKAIEKNGIINYRQKIRELENRVDEFKNTIKEKNEKV